MIPRKYLHLIALARVHHFGKAVPCHVSPCTLSTSIRELGAVLVETRRAEKRSAFRHPAPAGEAGSADSAAVIRPTRCLAVCAIRCSLIPMIARKYLYLIALARERHFGKAAAACHVSPSTLSTAIRDLGAVLIETR